MEGAVGVEDSLFIDTVFNFLLTFFYFYFEGSKGFAEPAVFFISLIFSGRVFLLLILIQQ